VVGVVAIALRGRDRARHLPFAPYMAAATLATVLVFG
ncbi:MAG: hypothetical protein JWL70_275, partial [Acidimicrobiia bacterium]|nr:hypothetical protein [Acidimicrobiia bacterium]